MDPTKKSVKAALHSLTLALSKLEDSQLDDQFEPDDVKIVKSYPQSQKSSESVDAADPQVATP